MEWKPEKTSKTELEKRQAEYEKKLLEMAKRAAPEKTRFNSDKEIPIIPVVPEAEVQEKTPKPTQPEKQRPDRPSRPERPSRPVPEAEEPTPGSQAVPPVIMSRVREAQIDVDFEVEATVYKKRAEPTEEKPAEEMPSNENGEAVCEDITESPFGQRKEEARSEAKCCPPNFKEYIRKHNEQQNTCEKCNPSKKKWT